MDFYKLGVIHYIPYIGDGKYRLDAARTVRDYRKRARGCDCRKRSVSARPGIPDIIYAVFKIREEFETIVENPEMAVKILEGLGYLSVLQYEKRTELWKYGGTEIYIEELPKIGCFMEIEGAEKNIKKVAKTLGFDIQKGVKKSYREYFAELNKKKKEWFFPDVS